MARRHAGARFGLFPREATRAARVQHLRVMACQIGDQVGLVHSLATPAYRTLFGTGEEGNRGLFGIATGLAGTVVSLLSGVFSAIGNLAGTVSGSISGDISSNNPRRYNRNISGGGRGPIRENISEASDFLNRVSQDVEQVVSDYLVIRSQPDIQSLNSTISEIFLDYTSSPPMIPEADSLLSDAISASSDPALQNLSEEQAQRLQQDIENYTVENVSSEMRRTFLDILAQIKDYAGLSAGPALANNPEALRSFDLIFDDAFSDISFS